MYACVWCVYMRLRLSFYFNINFLFIELFYQEVYLILEMSGKRHSCLDDIA